MRCVLDVVSQGWESRLLIDSKEVVDGRPMKGKEKVVKECAKGADHLAPRGGHIIAVLDADHAHEAVGLPGTASVDEVTRAFAARVPRKDCLRFSLVLLDRNVESLIAAIADCDEGHRLAIERVNAALRQKDVNARDLLCGIAADESYRAWRDCVQDRVPSFRRLVALVRSLLDGERVDGVCGYLSSPA
jgi:hypothetical protein